MLERDDWLPLASKLERARVVIVDDDPRVLAVLSRMLDVHEVLVAQGAPAALALLDEGANVDAILCDVLMPDMNGIDLYRALESRHPSLASRVIFLSGGANTEVAREFLSSVPNRCLKKPPRRLELLGAIEQLRTEQPVI
jgi:CheY-like chemotaxis protein